MQQLGASAPSEGPGENGGRNYRVPISPWRAAGTRSCQPSPDLCHLPEQEGGAGEAFLIPTLCLTAPSPQQSSSMPTTRAEPWPFSGHWDLPLHPGTGSLSSSWGLCPSSLSQEGRSTAAAGCHLSKPCDGCITLNFCQQSSKFIPTEVNYCVYCQLNLLL